MKKQNNYICKIATIDEIREKWDYEIKLHNNNELYIAAKNEYLEEAQKGTRITYIGKLGNDIICDATIIIKEEGIKKESSKTDNLISDKRCFMCAVRTNEEYQNKGYFSKLYKYIEEDLKKRGYKEISLYVDVSETKNLLMYFHWNYINYIRTEIKYSKTREYIFNYYYKEL